jgi:hypothetical protein
MLQRSHCGRSSGVEHDLAKVGVEGSNPFARSNFSRHMNVLPHQFWLVAVGRDKDQGLADGYFSSKA